LVFGQADELRAQLLAAHVNQQPNDSVACRALGQLFQTVFVALADLIGGNRCSFSSY
jgi:hypothetical protein